MTPGAATSTRNANRSGHARTGQTSSNHVQRRGHMPDNVLTEDEYRTFRRIAAQETSSRQSMVSFDSRLVQLIDGHFSGEGDAFAILKELASAGWAVLQGELQRRRGRA